MSFVKYFCMFVLALGIVIRVASFSLCQTIPTNLQDSIILHAKFPVDVTTKKEKTEKVLFTITEPSSYRDIGASFLIELQSFPYRKNKKSKSNEPAKLQLTILSIQTFISNSQTFNGELNDFLVGTKRLPNPQINIAFAEKFFSKPIIQKSSGDIDTSVRTGKVVNKFVLYSNKGNFVIPKGTILVITYQPIPTLSVEKKDNNSYQEKPNNIPNNSLEIDDLKSYQLPRMKDSRLEYDELINKELISQNRFKFNVIVDDINANVYIEFIKKSFTQLYNSFKSYYDNVNVYSERINSTFYVNKRFLLLERVFKLIPKNTNEQTISKKKLQTKGKKSIKRVMVQ